MWCVWHTEAAQTWPFGASVGVCWADRCCPQPCRARLRPHQGLQGTLLTAAGTRHSGSSTTIPTARQDSIHSMAVRMSKGWVALAMPPNNYIAGTEEEENCGNTQQIKYAKYLHLVERKCISRVCYLYNLPKQAIEMRSDFRLEIWVFSN